jgi:hypothetical protein
MFSIFDLKRRLVAVQNLEKLDKARAIINIRA